MKKGEISSVIMILAALLVLSPIGDASSFAQGNIRLGKLKVKPSIGYRAAYNDNIYYSPDDKDGDLIHTLSPTIEMGYQDDPGNYLAAGYKLDMVAYTDEDQNNYLRHNPYLLFGYRSSRGFYAKIYEQFVHTEDPYGSENQYKEGDQVQRWNNNLGMTLGYEFGRRYAAEVGYRNYLQRYEHEVDQWQEHTDHQYSGALLYKLSPKTSVFGEYRHKEVSYDSQNDGIQNWNSENSQDYSVDDFLLGVRFLPGKKLSGELKTGYSRREHENNTGPDGQSYEDQDAWVAEVNLDYQLREQTLINLNLQRTHKGASKRNADVASYLDTLISLELRQGIGQRFDLNLGSQLAYNDYFTIYSLTSGLEWRIRKWLRAGLGYEFRSKNADDIIYEGEEYDQNLIYFQVNAMF